MPLPQELIERVRDASDIVEVVGEHVTLKRAGRTWKALCPFHKEKSPSFIVNSDSQIFKCFGCGMGGDVFRFVMEFDKLSFPETVEHLAGRGGIPLPRRSWEGPRDESVYPALDWAAGFYRSRLEAPAGQQAREYLERRDLGNLVLERYGVGWVPEAWSTLLDAAGRKYSPELLVRAGLAAQNDRGGFYDRFRGRVMIPIRSPLGKTIGFGARTLGDDEPKYLNSPETEVFVKSKVLYGLAEARDALKDKGEALVVEGYMDVLALAQAGFLNTVASCGTAFTSDQARILKRYVDRAVLVFDGDQAGLRAAWKVAGVFLGEGLEVRIVALPEEEDPDSFIRKRGAEAFAALIEGAPGVVGFARETLLDRMERREDLVRAFAYLASRMDDEIRRRLLLQEAAETFRFEEGLLARESERLRRGDRSREKSPAHPAEVREKTDTIGRAYLVSLLEGQELTEQDLVPEDVLEEEGLRVLYRRWCELYEAGGESPLHELVSAEDTRDLVTEVLALERAETDDFSRVVTRLRDRERKVQGRRIREAIQQAETRGDQGEVARLLRELQGIKETGAESVPRADDGSGGVRC